MPMCGSVSGSKFGRPFELFLRTLDPVVLFECSCEFDPASIIVRREPNRLLE